MQPFGGAESNLNSPFIYIQIGRITDILDDKKLDSGVTTHYVPDNFMSIAVEWLEWGGSHDGNFSGKTGIIKLPSPHISRGHGFLYFPSKGDIVVCGFKIGGYPVVISYLPQDIYNKMMGANEAGYYLRKIQEGEYSLKGKQGNEIYHDRKGSIQIITRDQSQTHDVTIDTGFEKITDTVVEDNPQTVITIGSVWNKDFKVETLSSEGNSIRVQIEDKSKGTKIIVDSGGNVIIDQLLTSKFIVNGANEADILGNTKVARINDTTQLQLSGTDIQTLATALLATGAFTPTGSPPSVGTPTTFTDGKITSGSDKVKVG